VRFDKEAAPTGLDCHNDIECPDWTNALWMLRDDLEPFAESDLSG